MTSTTRSGACAASCWQNARANGAWQRLPKAFCAAHAILAEPAWQHRLWLLAPVFCFLCTPSTFGQAPQDIGRIEAEGIAIDPGQELSLAIDDDDDDEDGVSDGVQADHVPHDDLLEFTVDARQPDQPLTVSTLGGLRVIRNGTPLSLPRTLVPEELPAVLHLQATHLGTSSRPLALVVEHAGQARRIGVRAVRLRLLDGFNRPLSSDDALSISHRVTNDPSLPHKQNYVQRSGDSHDVRVELSDRLAKGMRLHVTLESLDESTGKQRDRVVLELSRPRVGLPFRSRFVRLVGDAVDREARGVAGQVLRVALRDRVRLRVGKQGSRMQQDYRVARPGSEDSPLAARMVDTHIVVLRARPAGPPVVGVDDLSALRILRDEVAIANEIWLQCNLSLGAPNEAAITIADPPPATLLAVADGNGLPAFGGGALRFRIGDVAVGPVATRSGDAPVETALNLARALEDAGFDAVVTVNPSTVFGAGESADVLVRHKDGSFVSIEEERGHPLSSDQRQTLSVGKVDLGDGLMEFNNMTAQSGTLEERTLLKALGDDNPQTIDLFIVNRFTQGTRQGEAFIEASSGPLINAVIVDRNGLRQRQTAWTMAHELGHVLLNQPLHPDNLGPDRPSLLMDADNNRGTVNGPKRLPPEDCERVRYESGIDAVPPLLRRP